MADEKPTGNNVDWRGVTKWLSIGVVLIVLIFVLKEPLGGLINRSTKVVINEKGVEILAAETAVGQINYSAEKVKKEELPQLKSEEPENTVSFASEEGYYMTWPKGLWKRDNEKLQYLQANSASFLPPGYVFDMVCTKTRPSKGTFTPNINIITGFAVAGTSVKTEMEDYKNVVTINMQGNIINEQIDEATQGAILTFTAWDATTGMELYYIQKFLRSAGKQYIVTATTIKDDDEETKRELQSILNSFRIVE